MKENENYPNIRQAVWLVVLFLLISIALAVLIEIIGRAIDYPLNKDHLIELVIGILGFFIILRWGLNKTGSTFQEVFEFQPVKAKTVVPIAFIVIGVGIIISDFDNLFRLFFPAPDSIIKIMNELFDGSIASFFMAVIIGPVTEELLFRGLILRGFLKNYSVKKAVIASSILFGLFHVNPWQIMGATALGIIFAWIFVETRSLWLCFFAHAFNNFLVFILSVVKPNIPGLVPTGLPGDAAQFQPLWLDFAGLIFAIVGFWMLITIFNSNNENLREGDSVAT